MVSFQLIVLWLLSTTVFFSANAFSAPLPAAAASEWARSHVALARRVQSLRGGDTSLALADYSNAASALFNNMRTPASLLGGSIVPLGFAAVPQIAKDDSAAVKFGKRLHMLLAIASLSNQLISIVYSTIAINKLSETIAAPTATVMELLQRDYELAWLGTNVHFLLGLFTFSLLLGFRAWFVFGGLIGRMGMFMAGSVLCFSVSIVNSGIAAGDGSGQVKFAASFLGLLRRYIVLAVADIWKTRGILQLASLGLAIAAAVTFVTNTGLENE